jgi:membrane protein required for colicin V production
MIAVATQSFDVDQLPFGWFDVVLAAVLGFGLFRGRKNGMTKELLPMLQWLITVLVCGLAYEMVGKLIINLSGWTVLTCYLLSYFGLMFFIYLGFHTVNKIIQPRLTGSNFFGSGEYYLGMASGMIRYTCMLFVALALLNAPYFTAAEIKKEKDDAHETYGAGLKEFGGGFFLAFHPSQIQEAVFQKAFTGKYIKQYADVMLINTESAANKKSSLVPQKNPVIHIGS